MGHSVDWRKPLYFAMTDERAFIFARPPKDCNPTVYDTFTVYGDDGKALKYNRRGEPLDEGNQRHLCNMPRDQLIAHGRIQIKRAQRERALKREQEQIDRLADLNPELFGSF